MINLELFLKQKIKEYYEKNPINIDNIFQREFGYGIYGKKIVTRNLSFKTNAELNFFLKTKVPFYLSYSAAYYKDPANKKDKHYLGGDLVFEFDADDIPTKCKKDHDSWYCEHCGESGKGHVLKCPNCGRATKISEWVCDNCIKATKKQTRKLYNILTKEFDFEEKELQIMFSGHKGFHIKIKSPKVYDLKQHQRVEIMNYISEDGLSFKELGFIPDNKGSIKYVGKKYGKGWKYLNYLIIALEKMPKEDLFDIFEASPQTFKKILENKEIIIEKLKKGIFYAPKKDSVSLWYNALNKIKELNKIYIDKQTTIDIKKIIRAENTIHGGAMLVSKVINIDDLKNFNPFYDASPFKKGTLRVKLKKVPNILLNKEKYYFEENEIADLPLNIALYFIAKGVVNDIIL